MLSLHRLSWSSLQLKRLPSQLFPVHVLDWPDYFALMESFWKASRIKSHTWILGCHYMFLFYNHCWLWWCHFLPITMLHCEWMRNIQKTMHSMQALISDARRTLACFAWGNISFNFAHKLCSCHNIHVWEPASRLKNTTIIIFKAEQKVSNTYLSSSLTLHVNIVVIVFGNRLISSYGRLWKTNS